MSFHSCSMSTVKTSRCSRSRQRMTLVMDPMYNHLTLSLWMSGCWTSVSASDTWHTGWWTRGKYFWWTLTWTIRRLISCPPTFSGHWTAAKSSYFKGFVQMNIVSYFPNESWFKGSSTNTSNRENRVTWIRFTTLRVKNLKLKTKLNFLKFKI